MAGAVDIYWTKGTEIASTSDATIHCRAGHAVAGIPASWRGGERGAFMDRVLSNYANAKSGAMQNNQISLSDSGTHLAIGVGTGTPLGIDIERLKPVEGAAQTLLRLGTDGLSARLSELAPPARNSAFLTVWTAFEAFLKLERLPWELGAKRFASMAGSWIIGSTGEVEFRGSERAGVSFWHARVPGELVIAAATPKPVSVALKSINVAAKARIASK
jgi:phosphopantetheinyl transferase